jgi:hypothetical protein
VTTSIAATASNTPSTTAAAVDVATTTPVSDRVAAALASGEWREYKDPRTGRLYAFNKDNKKTVWREHLDAELIRRENLALYCDVAFGPRTTTTAARGRGPRDKLACPVEPLHNSTKLLDDNDGRLSVRQAMKR